NTFSTFGEARAFVENYVAQTNIVTILRKTTRNSEGNSYRQAFFICEKQGAIIEKIMHMLLSEQYNHVIYPDARKFSINMRKIDQNELSMIEDLYNKGLRTKDIYTVLASVSSKTLENDKNIIASIATKSAYNNEHDQDGSFIQAIFWAY
ncbi:6429_t:CDS:2, partial [Racocetra persica]